MTDEDFNKLQIHLSNSLFKVCSNMTIDELKKIDWFTYDGTLERLDKKLSKT